MVNCLTTEDRLTTFARTNGDAQSWNLSLVGDWNNTIINGTQQNRTHNAVHELLTVNTTPLTYDVKGNITQNSNGQFYTWDVENRLTLATDGFNTLGSYTYDALGRRVSKTVGGNTTVFVSDGLQEICEYENNVLTRSYVFGSYIDEPLAMIKADGTKYYYHTNDLYSVGALTDAAGNVVERYKYDPYGKVTILAADGVTVRTNSIVENPWTFTGRRLDAETGLMYFRNRTWDVNLGQFIGRDPMGYVDGMSLYRGYFVPNGLDPMGLFWGKFLRRFLWKLDNERRFLDECERMFANTKKGGYYCCKNVKFRSKHEEACKCLDNSPEDVLPKCPSNLGVGPVTDRPVTKEDMIQIFPIVWMIPSMAGTAGVSAVASLENVGLRPNILQRPTSVSSSGTAVLTSPPSPQSPVGNRGSPLAGTGNKPTNISGRDYTGHSIDQMQNRGIPPSAVENTIEHGVSSPGIKHPGSTDYIEKCNKLKVVTDEASGRVITVITK